MNFITYIFMKNWINDLKNKLFVFDFWRIIAIKINFINFTTIIQFI